MCRDSRAWSQQRRRRSLLGRSESGRATAALDTMSLTEEEAADCADIGEKFRQAGEFVFFLIERKGGKFCTVNVGVLSCDRSVVRCWEEMMDKVNPMRR